MKPDTCTWIKVTESSSFKELVPFLSLYCGIWKHPLRFWSLSLGHPKKSHLHASSLLKVPIPVQFSSVAQSCPTPWTVAHQASLSITIPWSLLKHMSIESVMPSNHPILCHPLLLPSIFPSIRVFPMGQFFTSGGQNIGTSASASVLPMNIQDWFPLGWTGWISLLSKGLSRVFSNTTV